MVRDEADLNLARVIWIDKILGFTPNRDVEKPVNAGMIEAFCGLDGWIHCRGESPLCPDRAVCPAGEPDRGEPDAATTGKGAQAQYGGLPAGLGGESGRCPNRLPVALSIRKFEMLIAS